MEASRQGIDRDRSRRNPLCLMVRESDGNLGRAWMRNSEAARQLCRTKKQPDTARIYLSKHGFPPIYFPLKSSDENCVESAKRRCARIDPQTAAFARCAAACNVRALWGCLLRRSLQLYEVLQGFCGASVEPQAIDTTKAERYRGGGGT